jgi:phosphoribosylanthranilate isomerase
MTQMVMIKICGITNLADARAASDAGADLLGFVFFPQSPRYVEPEGARRIVDGLKNHGSASEVAGVFVDEPLEYVRRIMDQVGLDWVQLHGAEPPEMLGELMPRVYKALRPRDAADAAAQISTYRAILGKNSPAFVVDAFEAARFGGTGRCADWSLAAQIATEFPILLAGGLSALNVDAAIHSVRPWGVDVSSGVEDRPGIKNHKKLREFIETVKKH